MLMRQSRAMRKIYSNDQLTLRDVGAGLAVVLIVIGVLSLLPGAIEGNAAFYEQRVAAHQAECLAAQAEAQ